MLQNLLIMLKGLGIGLLVAAPIGPVNLICIRRTLAFGRLNGFLTSTGAALGDGVFALFVAFSITAASQAILGYSGIVQFVGGGILIGMGLRTYLAAPPDLAAPGSARTRRRRARLQALEGQRTLFGAMSSTFLLTITNPLTLMGFFALFAGLSATLAEEGSCLTAGLLVASVIAGSMLWWLILTSFTGFFRGDFTARRLGLINRIAGALTLLFGVAVLARLAFDAWRSAPGA